MNQVDRCPMTLEVADSKRLPRLDGMSGRQVLNMIIAFPERFDVITRAASELQLAEVACLLKAEIDARALRKAALNG